MNRLLVILIVLAGALMLGARAQDTALTTMPLAQSPSYVCTFGNGGAYGTAPCVQYIVEVSTARLGGGVFIYQVTGNPVDVSQLSQVTAAAGTVAGTSVQELLPNNAGGTFTLAVTRP